MRKRLNKAEKATKDAEKALVEADILAESDRLEDKKMARKLRKIAKRLHSKAQRRLGRIVCNDY